MATTLFLNGRVTATPGSYSIIDASGLEQTGLGAKGLVAIIGEAEGGVPVSSSLETSKFMSVTRPEKVRKLFRSGDLREAGAMMFEPSSDSDILAGAQKIFFMKTNQATQAGLTLVNALGTVATALSDDYGAFTDQIALSQANGSNKGKHLVVTFEDTTEAADDVGGDNIFSLEYLPDPGLGWETMLAQVQAGGIYAYGQRTDVGRETDLTATTLVTSGTRVSLTATAGDVGVVGTVFGLDMSGNPQRETITLINGTQNGAKTWTRVDGLALSVVAAGTVTLKEVAGGAPTLLAISAAGQYSGVSPAASMFVGAAPLSVQVDLAASDSIATSAAAVTTNVLALTVGSGHNVTVGTHIQVAGLSSGFNTTVPVAVSAVDATHISIPFTHGDGSAGDGVGTITILEQVTVWGKNASGVAVAEKVGLTNAWVRTSTLWSQVDWLVLGQVDANVTMTVGAVAAKAVNTTQKTLKQVADYFNARQISSGLSAPDPTAYGFLFTLETSKQNFKTADLDQSAVAASIFSAAVQFKADLYAVLKFYNESSQLVGLTRIAFQPEIVDITITATVATYTATIGGFTATYVSSGGTLADIQAGLLAQINADPRIMPLGTAAAVSTNKVEITGLTPTPMNVSVGANLAAVVTQTIAGVGSVPTNYAATFLTGGSEGVSSFNDFQNALNLLKKIRVNSIVSLSADPAVAAALDAHCAFMCGIGRSERDGFVGLLNTDLDGLPTKTEALAQIVDINSRHIRAFAQSVDRFNTAGERTRFLSPFQAVIACGMQAGAPVGTALTHKYANVLDVTQDPSWNPVDDSDEMINGGLCFMEAVDGVGRRWVRNVTTWLKDNNLAFIEGSVNEAVNFAVFEFRTAMEIAVGKPGFAGTINAAKGVAGNKLSALIDANDIVAWQALSFELTADVLEVSVQIAPIIPINFVLSTVHLVTISQAA